MHRTRRTITATVAAGTIIFAASLPAAAATPNGLKGYEGQPGNQGGHGHHGTPNGLKGYEGQPGNQGG
jgi:Spy/CpxP family protein refolding chaperone